MCVCVCMYVYVCVCVCLGMDNFEKLLAGAHAMVSDLVCFFSVDDFATPTRP